MSDGRRGEDRRVALHPRDRIRPCAAASRSDLAGCAHGGFDRGTNGRGGPGGVRGGRRHTVNSLENAAGASGRLPANNKLRIDF